jgi:short-subunit dehydrogenase
MQRVIIIGASSGIGREMARIYAKRGAKVGITGRRNELLHSLQPEFPEAISMSCFDATSPDAIAYLEELIRELGGLDILIYCAGYGEPSKDLDWTIDKATTDINVSGFLRIINFGYNFFIDQGHGHLVTISSIASRRGNDYAPAYSAGKAFQSTYFEGLHMKLTKLKLPIYVTDVQPGFVDTRMAKSKKLFWVAPVEKAAQQIINAIDKKKWRVYITRRWVIIAWLLKWIPDFIYFRLR